LQVGLISSLRKMELTSGTKGIANEKFVGQFLLTVNTLTDQQGKLNQMDAQAQHKEGLNQLLTLLSNSSDVLTDDEISVNLEKLLNTYSDQSDIDDLETFDMNTILADLLAAIENKITQVLTDEINTKITPDMFNHTELSTLLSDLKLLENTVNSSPDLTMNEKVSQTVQDLQGLIASLNSSDFKKNFSIVDMKLLTMQNRVLQENKNIAGNESKTTNQKIVDSKTLQSNLYQANGADNNVIEANTELKTIISSILTKLDKQIKEKNTTVVPKVINPIMVSSLRQSEELLVSNTEIMGTVEVSDGDTDTKAFSPIQNTFIKQHPLMLLSDSGELAQPKNVEEQFAKILANSTFTKTGDMQKLSIRLAPDHLGSIRIEITQNEGNMIARIITTTTEAKEVLDRQLNSLKQGFTAQNLQIDKMDVVVSSQPQERLQREQQQQQEQQQSDAQRDKKDADDNDNKRKASFIEELLNIEV